MYTDVRMVYPGKDSPCLQRIPFVHREKISKKLCEIRKKRNSQMRWDLSNVFQQEMTQNFKIAVIEDRVLHVSFGFECCIIWQLKTKDLIVDDYGNESEITLYAIAEENRYKGVNTNVQDWQLVHDYQIQDASGVYNYFCAKSGVFSKMGVSIYINGVFVQTLESFREEIFSWLPGSSELQVDKKLLFNANGEKKIEIELDKTAIRRNLKSQKNPNKYKSICNSMKTLGYNNLDTFCNMIIQTMYSMIRNVENIGDLIEIQRYFKDGKIHDEFILPLEIKRGDYCFKASIACIQQRDENDRVYGIVGRAVNPAFVTMSNVALAHENGEVSTTSWVSQMYNNRHSFFEQLQVKKGRPMLQAEPSQSVLQQQQHQQQQQHHQRQELRHTQGQQVQKVNVQQGKQGQHGPVNIGMAALGSSMSSINESQSTPIGDLSTNSALPTKNTLGTAITPITPHSRNFKHIEPDLVSRKLASTVVDERNNGGNGGNGGNDGNGGDNDNDNRSHGNVSDEQYSLESNATTNTNTTYGATTGDEKESSRFNLKRPQTTTRLDLSSLRANMNAQKRTNGYHKKHGATPSQQVDASTVAFVHQGGQCQQNEENKENKENEVNTAAATGGVRTIHSRNKFGQGVMVNSNLDGGKNEKKENNVYIGNVLVKNVQGSDGWYGDRNRKIDERRMGCSVLNNKEYGQTQGQEAPKIAKETRKEYSTVGSITTIEKTEETEEKKKTGAARNKTKNTTEKKAEHIVTNNKQSLVGTITTAAGKELKGKSELLKISNARVESKQSKILSSEDGVKNCTCNDSGGIGRMRHSGDNNDDATKTMGNSNAVQLVLTEANMEEKNLEEKENINNEISVLNVGFEKIDSYESCPFSRARLLVTSQVLPQEMILGLNEKLKHLEDEKKEKHRNTFGCDGTLRWLKRKLEERDAVALAQVYVPVDELGAILTPIERCGSDRKKMEKMKKEKVNRLDKYDELIMKIMASIVSVESVKKENKSENVNRNENKNENENENENGVGLTKPLVNNYGSCDCDDNEMNDASSSIVVLDNDENKRKKSTCSHSGWTGGKKQI